MGLPEPIEPESHDDVASRDDTSSWLVGAEEGIEAELSRNDKTRQSMPAPKLFRPGADAPAEPPARSVSHDAPSPPPALSLAPPPTLSRPQAPVPVAAIAPAPSPAPARREFPAPDAGLEGSVSAPKPVVGIPLPSADEGFTRGNVMVWEPGANSVPTVRREAPARTTPVPEPTRDFPMDDAEERARATAEARALATVSAEQSVRPHTIVAPDAFDLETAPLPWWMQVPAQLRTDRRLQILCGIVVLLLATVAFWPRGPKPESLGALNKHPDRFDGHIVTVAGRVGDVFEVGGGHAYYLQQDHDTLVVFTRGTAPRRRDNVTLSGTVSTGYLDGEPHLALFELSKD